MKKTHNKSSKFLLFAVPVGLIAAGTIAFFATRSHKPDQTCTDNVARLEALASSDISQTEKMLRDLKNKEKSAAEEASQEGITDGSSVLDDVAIKQAFQGTVIIGDSITESIWEYGFLDTDVVISKRGLSIAAADEQIETAIGLQPSVIFMAFGSNDLETYIDDSAAFIDAYRVQVQKLKDALPDAPIYINGILPILQSTIDSVPALGYYPQYNEALQAFCQEMGCTYIDNSFIVDGNETMYEPDGEHVIRDFYPKWLTYMAETAGL
ncbi:MAG: GDSL-type esterase/lipase family protein [Blautia sp.]|nr:GDSL-type esterase/lipase family protein [Blautia sp.]